MKNIILIIMLGAAFGANAWQNVGSVGFSASGIFYTSLKLDNAGVPYVAFRDFDNGEFATVMKFNGTDWELVGNAGFSSNRAKYVNLDFDDNNVPFVGFQEEPDDTGPAAVYSFNGSTWEAVGASPSTGNVSFTTFGLDGSGVPYIAYQDVDGVNGATVRKFNGSTWENVGTQAFSGGPVNYISLAFDSADTPFLAYYDVIPANPNYGMVQRFNGSAWEVVGGTGFTDFQVSYCSLDIDAEDNPVVAFIDYSNSQLVSVRAFDGVNWNDVGTPGFYDGTAAFEIEFAISPDDTMHVCFKDTNPSGGNGISVMKFNGTAWEFLGDQNVSAGNASFPSLDFAADGTPYLGYRSNPNQGRAGVMSYREVPEPEMVVLADGIEISSEDTEPSTDDFTDFGTLEVGADPITVTYTISNSGTADLTLSNDPRVELTGDTDSFSVTSDAPALIGPGENETFVIQFDPPTTGLKTATVSIANDDTDENPYTFAIQGTGIISGCTDPAACNYNPLATDDDGGCLENDCNNDCGGTAFLDDCGICSEGNSGHTANNDIDDCDVCPDGTMGLTSDDPAPDGYTYEDGPDCNMDCFGTAFFDDCGICSEGNSGHTANNDIDDCDVCPDGTMGLTSDDPAPDGYTYEDGPDCNMDCFGTAFFDDCGICSEGNSGHTANIDIDDCDVCPDGTMGLTSDDPAPDGYTYEDGPDCHETCFGTAVLDECSVCCDGTTGVDCSYFADQFDFAGAYDCAGVCFGLSENDVCGICDDDSENDGVSCFGCADPAAMNFNEPCISEYGMDCLDTVEGNLTCDYMGDFNDDQAVDIADIIAMLDIYLYDIEPTSYQLETCDLFADDAINILDVVMIIEIILGETLLKPELPTFAELIHGSTGYRLNSDGSISAVELLTAGSYSLLESDSQSGWMVTSAGEKIIALNLEGCTNLEPLNIAYDGEMTIVDNLVYDWDGGFLTAEVKEIPDGFALNNPYPNPFNPVVNLQYEVPDAAQISIVIYDITGRQVQELVSSDQVTEAGFYTLRWNAEAFPSGIYILRMQTIRYVSTQKLILLK